SIRLLSGRLQVRVLPGGPPRSVRFGRSAASSRVLCKRRHKSCAAPLHNLHWFGIFNQCTSSWRTCVRCAHARAFAINSSKVQQMSLQFLDKTVIGSYLQAMWKRDLNTGKDPANGKWFENGANNDHVGLYGGLTDNAATQLAFNESQK